MDIKGAFILFPVVLTIILADCVGSSGGITDCGTDLVCFYASAKLCTPAKVTTEQSQLSIYLEVKPASGTCNIYTEVKSAPDAYSSIVGKNMLCPNPENFTGMTAEFIDSCSGNLQDVLSNYLYPPETNACSDGTPYGECSSTKPLYCDNGLLTDKCSSCGCPSGTTCDQTFQACRAQRCSDGTRYNQCSLGHSPIYCDNGTIINKCSVCGCVTGQSCNQTSNQCYVSVNPQTCSDGTLYGQCSTTKPKYCNNGNLTISCSTCGCPTGQSCNQTTSACYAPVNPQLCSDGTIYGQCSVNKPKYCNNNGVLSDLCLTCGCPVNYGCYIPSQACIIVYTMNVTGVYSSNNVCTGIDIKNTFNVSIPSGSAFNILDLENGSLETSFQLTSDLTPGETEKYTFSKNLTAGNYLLHATTVNMSDNYVVCSPPAPQYINVTTKSLYIKEQRLNVGQGFSFLTPNSYQLNLLKIYPGSTPSAEVNITNSGGTSEITLLIMGTQWSIFGNDFTVMLTELESNSYPNNYATPRVYTKPLVQLSANDYYFIKLDGVTGTYAMVNITNTTGNIETAQMANHELKYFFNNKVGVYINSLNYFDSLGNVTVTVSKKVS